MNNYFDYFVGIDWSGAKGSIHKGIAIALSSNSSDNIEIIKPRTKNGTFSVISILITLIFLFPVSSISHEIEEKKIEKIIQNFLVKEPELIRSILDDYKISFERQKFKKAIKDLRKIQNPGIFQKNADITIYEFFDYNCGYCKSVLKVVQETLSEDKNINFVFVEYYFVHFTHYAITFLYSVNTFNIS